MVSGEVLIIVFIRFLDSPLTNTPPPAHQTLSDSHHYKAAAAERPVKSAVGTVGKFILIVWFLYVKLTPRQRPPSFHSKISTSCIWVCTSVGLRSRIFAGAPEHSRSSKYRTAAGSKTFPLVCFCLCCALASLWCCGAARDKWLPIKASGVSLCSHSRQQRAPCVEIRGWAQPQLRSRD